jgi:beta-glucanase (GH16 family)
MPLRMRIFCCLFLLLFFFNLILAAPPKTSNWILTFEDNFELTSLDTNKWHPHDHFCGVRNNELQAYIPENVIIENGLCKLKCEKKNANYGYCGLSSIVKEYASGIIISMNKFDQKYGYFEIRCKIPKGKGYWPAFWLLPYNKWPPEIDILEILGHEPNKVYMTNHYIVNGQHQSTGSSFLGPDFSKDFHTFGVEWDSLKLVWYVDSIERFRSTNGIPQEPFYILINLALGGSWPGSPDSTTIFPGFFEIDWVRAYKKTDTYTLNNKNIFKLNNINVYKYNKTLILHNNNYDSYIKIFMLKGQEITRIFINANSTKNINLTQQGIYLLQIKNDKYIKQIKILY